MEKNGMLIENEKQANIIAAKVMRVTFVIFCLVYLLNVFGVFVIDHIIMTTAFIGGSILLLMPTVFVNIMKLEAGWVKYFNVISTAVFVTLLSITLTFHVVVIYVYPIAIASLYFSKLLNIAATALTVVGGSAGQIIAFVLKTLPDDNFPELKGTIIYGVIPRALTLIAVAAIFTMLTSRTADMLSSLLGAKEQELMLERMNNMKNNAGNTAEVMQNMVEQLSGIAQSSAGANKSIAKEAERLLNGSMQNMTAVEDADGRIWTITGQLAQLNEMNQKTSKLTDSIGESTRKNQERMDEATISMNHIHESTNECKMIISSLGEESKEIIGIVQTITNISTRTNILALNASIEAARAGEHGKGFAVVADEIQKLSEQTKKAVESIGAIVHEVVKNTDDAVVAMERNSNHTKDGMRSIQLANESTAVIAASNEELSQQIHEIAKVAEIIRGESNEVADHMKYISSNTQLNCSVVEQVTAASQENSAGTESLVGAVEQIKGLVEQLNSVVHE